MMSNQEYVCCICGKKFTGWGNNPYPVVDDDDARCCDICNEMRVLPARMAQFFASRKEKK